MKLTPEEIVEARQLYEYGVPRTRLAKRYGVTVNAITYHVCPEIYARHTDRFESMGVYAEDYARIAAEAKRRGVSKCRLVHELVERGIPRRHPEAAE